MISLLLEDFPDQVVGKLLLQGLLVRKKMTLVLGQMHLEIQQIKITLVIKMRQPHLHQVVVVVQDYLQHKLLVKMMGKSRIIHPLQDLTQLVVNKILVVLYLELNRMTKLKDRLEHRQCLHRRKKIQKHLICLVPNQLINSNNNQDLDLMHQSRQIKIPLNNSRKMDNNNYHK